MRVLIKASIALAAASLVCANDIDDEMPQTSLTLVLMGKNLKGQCSVLHRDFTEQDEANMKYQGFHCDFDGFAETCINLNASRDLMSTVCSKWCGDPNELVEYEPPSSLGTKPTDEVRIWVNNGYLVCAVGNTIQSATNTLIVQGFTCVCDEPHKYTCTNYMSDMDQLTDLKTRLQCLLGSRGPFSSVAQYTIMTIRGGYNNQFSTICLAANYDENHSTADTPAKQASQLLVADGFSRSESSDGFRVTFYNKYIRSREDLDNLVSQLPCHHEPSNYSYN